MARRKQWRLDRSVVMADHLGYPYPLIPPEGARQVLGSMSTDENITPIVPDWVPKRLYTRWSELWHRRVKQYKYPHSPELLPWDTTHNMLGDYNDLGEFYVEGCFGYDEDGKEIMYRPGIPEIHEWFGAGLRVYTLQWPTPEPQPPNFTMFNFYTSTSRLLADELDDIKSKKLSAVPASYLEASCKDHEDALVLEDNLLMNLGPDIFEDPLKDLLPNQAVASKTTNALSKDYTLSKLNLGSFPVKTSISVNNTDTITEHTSPTKSHKAKYSLTSLPGEIRNLIYQYLFDESKEYEIVWCTPQKDLTHYVHKIPIAIKGFKIGWRHKCRDDDSLDKYFERPVLDRKGATARRRYARSIYGKYNHETRVEDLQSAGPAAFLLTCRQAYRETVSLFYGQHTFSFCSRSILRNFISKLSPQALGSIKRLYIAHEPRAWPLKITDAVLVEKEYKHWIQDLSNVVADCTSLQELTMLVQIRDPHVNNTDRAEWAMALRRGLAGLKDIKSFQYFDLMIRLADDTSNTTLVEEHGTRLQIDRARDLQDLVRLVKNKIFA